MTMPQSLQTLLSTETTPIQNLGFALYDLIASLTAGTVVGPGVSVNNDVAVWSGVTGQVLKDTGILYTSLVLGPASAVNLNLVVFDTTTGKLIKDGGQTIAQVIAAAVAASGNVVGPAGATNNDIAVFDLATGLLIKDGGQTIAQVIAAAVAASGNVVGPGSAVNLDLVVYDGTTGKLVKDTGILSTSVVLGPASVTNGNLAVFDGTTGKLIKDGGPVPSGGGTSLLGINRYAPTSNTFFSTTSATLADLDAVNMTVTFTAPASGNVLIRLTAYADLTISTGQGFWGLREGGANISGAGGVVVRNIDGNLYSMAIYLTGISGGSHTYKWSSGVSGGLTLRTGAGPGNTGATVSTTQGITPAVMEVWSAP